ncbi:MAG: rRNA maturation RNase YbeY [Candidatus Omnitrophica bacterium]|nr:rRNA maturation RNase YbeY [Candidatus Omnitrophota bacterium]
MRKIYVRNLTKTGFDSGFLKNIVRNICQIRRIEQKEIGIILLDDKKIQRYNLRYRGVNRPTDVLAFPVDERTGELFISLESARRQAEIYHQSLKKELSLLIIHGLLHFNGYKDTDRKSRLVMRKEEKNILNLLRKP